MNADVETRRYTTMDRGSHSLHESLDAADLSARFEASTAISIKEVVDAVVSSEAPRAIFAVGSLPLGMGSSGSDIDLIVLVDSRDALRDAASAVANNPEQLTFASDSDPLLAGVFLNMFEGVLVDLHVAIAPAIHDIYARLRRRGPDLSETEVRTLGRLSTGWLLGQSEGYLDRHSALLSDPALAIYCTTKHYVGALHQRSKATRALNSEDIPLALQHGRSAIEMTYLAYLASEGLTYLGMKWLAQIGHARGAAERKARHPVLSEGIPLLFPSYPATHRETVDYLPRVSAFMTAIRAVIEQKTLYRIAFGACAQIHPL
jgi:hypothetical protein